MEELSVTWRQIMRDKTIDCFKGILTIQMILAHCLQFYSNLDVEKDWRFLTEYINLTTFSGFVFAFGYVSYKVYVQGKFSDALKKIYKNIVRLTLAFYISSFAYVIFIERMPFRMDKILEIILLKRLAGWSEFLISFAGVMLVTILLWKLLKSQNIKYLFIIGVASILVCLLPHSEVIPIVGIFIGGHGSAYYPVIPYYLYFVIGVYFVRKEVRFNWYVLAVAIAGMVYTLYEAFFLSKGWPSRFPLSLAWLLGGMLFLYAYYLFAGFIGRNKYFFWLCEIGKFSLPYLLISNIIIFAVKQSSFYKISSAYSLGLFVVIMFIIWYMIGLVKGKAKNVKTELLPSVEETAVNQRVRVF
jgi:hypothetical protein